MNDKTQKPAPDYGEPWKAMSAGAVHNRNDNLVAGYSARQRMLSCVNACASMADPAAEIQAMRDAIKEAYEALLRVSECKIFYAESMDIDNHTTDDCASALANLKPFATP